MTIYTFLLEAPPPRTVFRSKPEAPVEAGAQEAREAVPERLLRAAMDAIAAFPEAFEAAVAAMRVITRELHPEPGRLCSG